MPLLKRRPDGGYYTVTRLPTGEFVTYQISALALDHLQSWGIGVGGEIPREELLRFREKKWIFTEGSGTQPAPLGTDVPERTLEALIQWGKYGRVDDLLEALSGARTSLPICITPGFVEWVCALEDRLALGDLTDISFSDFDRYAQHSGKSKLSSLHLGLLRREGGSRVLWHLTCLAAHVAAYPGFPEHIPASWRESVYEVMVRVLNRAFEWQGRSKRAARVKTDISLPSIYWKLYEQTIIGVLPAQTLLPGEELEWRVTPGDTNQPSVRQFRDKAVVPESYTEPLEPASWKIEIIHSKDGYPRIHTLEVQIPFPDGPYVVFEKNGKAISWEPESILKPGEYLLLATPEVEVEEVVAINQIRIIEEIDYEPIGWWDWKGFRILVQVGVVLGSYRFGVVEATVNWELEESLPSDIEFSETIPIWLERWPRFLIETSDDTIFEDAFLEIEHRGEGQRWVLPIVREASDTDQAVRIFKQDDGYVLDCNQCESLSCLSGSFGARLRFAKQIENSVSPLVFIVLSAVDLSYIPDSRNLGMATALSISGVEDVVPYARCALIQGCSDGTWELAAADPIQEPLIHFGVKLEGQKTEILLAVRLRVSRIAWLSRTEPLGVWGPLPTDIDLSKVDDLKARLKLELHKRPTVDQGKLVCRVVGGELVIAGKETTPYVFVIPLHRWRDRLGTDISGPVQVKCGKEWLVIADLVGKESGGRPPKPPDDPWLKRLDEIGILAVQGQESEVREQGQRIIEQVRRAKCSEVIKDFVLIRMARIYIYLGFDEISGDIVNDLKKHSTLPDDVAHVSTLLLLRTIYPDDEFLLLQGKIKRWGEGPHKRLALAEWSYRLGRMGQGGEGALREVNRDYLRNFVSHSLIEKSEAAMLKAITSFLLDEPFSPEEDVESLPWYANLQNAMRYLHTPLNQWTAEEQTGNQILWPTSVYQTDRIYLEAVLCQACRDISAASDRLVLLKDSKLEFPRRRLILARQARLTGDIETARRFYDEIIDLDIVLEELMTL